MLKQVDLHENNIPFRYEEECLSSKVDFWSRFIDLYYQGSGGSVKCCSGDGCNSGMSHDDQLNFKPHDITPIRYWTLLFSPCIFFLQISPFLLSNRSAPIQSAPPSSASLPGAPLSPFFTTANVLHGGKFLETLFMSFLKSSHFDLKGVTSLTKSIYILMK